MRCNRIRDLREDHELTQKEIAKSLNIAQRTYSGYETSSRNIPIEILIELASLYNTSIDYLLGLTDQTEPYKKKQKIYRNT
ncbi:helix-turn-helix domain-containing protein [Scatolibacter rhodanostii]|uniref:helix-turn-helix domain-containing protein n=1 Tax=Scatolibacter rhodanostii TaxID=2014781 RepID=UPI000C07EB62|nr:helix-turn-helix transcriptional regulator [Scatolibacter rhodanostii]